MWSRYAAERLLYRLSISEFADDFVLKGAMLFVVWSVELHRPTMDMDLLGYGQDSSDRVADIFRKICLIAVSEDGIVFDSDSVRVSPIRKDQAYHGQRADIVARLGKARIRVQVDIGFGDVVTPDAKQIDYPTILELPAPRIKACPRETVVAEKLHAMVVLGIANSRMKDFYDLHVLSRRFEFEGTILVKAIRATFKRRKTEIPTDEPLALTEEFAQDRTKAVQWSAFIKKSGLAHNALDLAEVISDLRRFLLFPLKAASGHAPVPVRWEAGGPWSE